MSLQQTICLADLREQIRAADAVTPALMADIIALAGMRLSALGASNDARRLQRLIQAEAWTEAAIALVDLELPHWKLVRLVCDDGEWCCTLSKHWQLPEWLDDTVDAWHASLPLAILAALLEARQTSVDTSIERPRTVPVVRPRQDGILDALCCDNFA
jgi:hypothetical protein